MIGIQPGLGRHLRRSTWVGPNFRGLF